MNSRSGHRGAMRSDCGCAAWQMRGDGTTRATEQDEDAACDDDLGTAEAVHKSGHEVSFSVGGDVSVSSHDRHLARRQD